MAETRPKLTFDVTARRTGAHGSEARCKSASLVLDTDLAGRIDAFNPAELLLAAVAACMIKSIERVTPLLKFDLRGVEVRLHGQRHRAARLAQYPGCAVNILGIGDRKIEARIVGDQGLGL